MLPCEWHKPVASDITAADKGLHEKEAESGVGAGTEPITLVFKSIGTCVCICIRKTEVQSDRVVSTDSLQKYQQQGWACHISGKDTTNISVFICCLLGYIPAGSWAAGVYPKPSHSDGSYKHPSRGLT